MKKLLIPLLLIFCMTECLGDDEPKYKIKDIMMFVSHETGFMYDDFDYDAHYPIVCMRVMSEDDPGVWHNLPLGSIDGFTYETGHDYDLLVKRTILANPPADASDRKYSLVRVISDKVYQEPKPAEPELPVTSESDIKYQENCPYNKYALYKSQFEVSADGKLCYKDGARTPGYDATRLYLENIMDKADPNFNDFNRIPYMAYRSYVFSPLTAEIRLVYNDSDGPMFKNVIPEDEYRYICDNVESGTELRYTLFLVNIDKLGLQKLDFTITKI